MVAGCSDMVTLLFVYDCAADKDNAVCIVSDMLEFRFIRTAAVS